MSRLVRYVAPVLSITLLGVLAALSVRGIVDPAGAAASFGVPVGDPAAELYQVVYRSRNLVLAIVGLAFAGTGQWRALAVLATASIALPAFDIWALTQAGLAVTAVHPATLAALVVLAGVLWARVGPAPGRDIEAPDPQRR
jgi:hypothetical protein